MKKLFIFIVSLCLSISSFAQSDDTLWFLQQFTVVNDKNDIKEEYINIEIYQTLADCAGLASECSDKSRNWYFGNTVFFLTTTGDLIYDGKVIKKKAYFVGTYTYGSYYSIKTVKVYIDNFEDALIFIEAVQQAHRNSY